MRRKTKALYFYSDLYHQGFYFLSKWSREQVAKDFSVEMEHSRAITFVHKGFIYIWIDSPCEEPVDCLVHECVHAANFVLGSRGVGVSAKDDEAQAYLVQWVFANCFNTLNRNLKK